ncbi:hypothetical protein [Mycobacterium sp. NPDC006124]|uniref:hypothetical protein n=1 Tax=Mycobacterium sp. NPDC006124 TaxID=3156729 RepID=UPI0033B0FD1E
MTKLIASMLAVVLLGAACTTSKEGTAVASPQPPQDVWQLADRLVALVPLSADKLADLLGTAFTPDPRNPLRLDGAAVQLSPSLQITSSVLAVVDGTWSFASVDVAPTPCVTEDVLKQHYPAAEITSYPSGHSPMEEFLWSTSYDWGRLSFGIREQDRCVAGVSLERAKP